MLVPPVITTVFKLAGTYFAFPEFPVAEEAPKIYPKCVLLVPFFVAPTKGIVMLVSPVQPENAY